MRMNYLFHWRCDKAVGITLHDLFECVHDPRGKQGRKYKMAEVLELWQIGLICGKKDAVNISHYLSLRADDLRKVMPLEHGVPSHDTFSDIMRKLNSDELALNVFDWISLFLAEKDIQDDQIILDGKASRASAEKNKDEPPPYIINAVLGSSKTFLYHSEVGSKENEIKVLPRALKVLDVKGKTITIDAIGTQKAIMELIKHNGGDFVFAVKGNQENLEDEVKTWIDDSVNNKYEKLEVKTTFDTNGGRRETRVHYFERTNECITDPEIQEMVKGIGRVDRHSEKDILDENNNVIRTEVTDQTVYYVTSRVMNVGLFAHYLRGHWIVESFHWVLDNIFREDRCRARKENARMNVSLMRKLAYNLLLFEKKKRPEACAFEYQQDELQFNLPAIARYFFEPVEKLSD